MDLLSVRLPLLLFPRTAGLVRGIVRLHSRDFRPLCFVVLKSSIHSRSLHEWNSRNRGNLYLLKFQKSSLWEKLVVLTIDRHKRGRVNPAQIKPITVAIKVQKWPLANENEEKRWDSVDKSKSLQIKKPSTRTTPCKGQHFLCFWSVSNIVIITSVSSLPAKLWLAGEWSEWTGDVGALWTILGSEQQYLARKQVSDVDSTVTRRYFHEQLQRWESMSRKCY